MAGSLEVRPESDVIHRQYLQKQARCRSGFSAGDGSASCRKRVRDRCLCCSDFSMRSAIHSWTSVRLGHINVNSGQTSEARHGFAMQADRLPFRRKRKTCIGGKQGMPSIQGCLVMRGLFSYCFAKPLQEIQPRMMMESGRSSNAWRSRSRTCAGVAASGACSRY